MISKGLTELYGGEIGVISEIGQGSEFYCIIPFEVIEVENIILANSCPNCVSISSVKDVLTYFKKTTNIETSQICNCKISSPTIDKGLLNGISILYIF